MKKWLFLFIWWFGVLYLSAQSLTIQDCWSLSREHYPLLKGKQSLMTASQLKMQNVKTAWLPQMELSGQATLQSDVPHVDLPNLPISIPSASKDQYKVALDVSQTIYDGGRTKLRSQLENLDGELEQTDIETQLQKIREVVTQLYFNVFILEAQKKQLNYISSDLDARLKELNVAHESGAVLKSALSSLKVEQLRLSQRQITVDQSQKQLLNSLSLFIGREVSSSKELVAPSMGDFTTPITRAEYDKFNLLQSNADVGVKLHQRNRRPVLAAFGQAGYGNPGFNMLNDEFDTFWLVGVKLKWTPWDWKQSRRNREVAEHQKELINFQRESFDLQQKRELLEVSGLAQQYLLMMEKDEEIIELQSEVTEDYRNQLKNGAITSSDYVSELNAEARARLDRDLHELQYLQSLAQQQQVGIIGAQDEEKIDR